MTQDNIPVCQGPDPKPKKPNFEIPPLACDTHAHIFGPESKYDYSPRRGYTPPDASLEDYLRLHAMLGMERGVLTQPSVYGVDNTAMLDAVAREPDRLRAVAAVDATVSDGGLQCCVRSCQYHAPCAVESKSNTGAGGHTGRSVSTAGADRAIDLGCAENDWRQCVVIDCRSLDAVQHNSGFIEYNRKAQRTQRKYFAVIPASAGMTVCKHHDLDGC